MRICARCKTVLTEDNCTHSDWSKASKCYCRDCRSFYNKQAYRRNSEDRKARAYKWRKDNPERLRATEEKRRRSVAGRHWQLKSDLKRENIPTTDLLWNLNFYTELTKDHVCHYCLGPVTPSGHNLDRMVNEIGHTCFNVVPCCRQCNRIKGEFWEYEHMMMLAPKLRKFKQEKLNG